MARHLQINPAAEGRQLPRGSALLAVLDRYAEDFAIRYCFIPEESAEDALEALSRLTPASDDERHAIAEIVALLQRRDEVELLYS